MSRSFTAASSQYLTLASAIKSATPWTFACWVKVNAVGTAQTIFCIGSTTSANEYFRLDIAASGQVRFRASTAGGSSDALSQGVIQAGVWTFVAARSNSAVDRRVYLGFDNGGTNAVSRIPTGLDITEFGSFTTTTRSAFFDGKIAYPTFWNTTVISSDMERLANGTIPANIDSANQISRWNLAGASPETDSVGANNLTVVGPTYSTDEPFDLANPPFTVLNICGFETGDLNNETVSSTGTAVTTTVRTGLYSFKVLSSNTSSGGCKIGSWSTAGTGTPPSFSCPTAYNRVYVRFNAYPASGTPVIFLASQDTAGTNKAFFKLNSNGLVESYDNSNTLVATGTTVVNLNVWVCFESMTSTSASPSAYGFRIDEAIELSGSMSQGSVNNGYSILGKDTFRPGALDAYFDDWAVSDFGWLGAGACLPLMPNANGTIMQFVSGAAPQDYTQVNDMPVNDTTNVVSSATANQRAYFDCAAMPTVHGRINGVKCFYRHKASAVANINRRLLSGGGEHISAPTTINTGYSNASLTHTRDPNTNAEWTEAGVNAAQVGVEEVSALAQTLSTIFLMVDYAIESNRTVLPVTNVSVNTYAPTITVTTAGGNSVTLPASAVSVATFSPSATTTEKNFSQITTSQVAVQTYAPTVTTTTLTFNNVSNLPRSSISVATYAPTIVVSRAIRPKEKGWYVYGPNDPKPNYKNMKGKRHSKHLTVEEIDYIKHFKEKEEQDLILIHSILRHGDYDD